MESNIITQVFLPTALFNTSMGMGLSLVIDDFRRVLRFPKAVAVGIVLKLKLIATPLIMFGLLAVIPLEPELAVGFNLLAAFPGGATANLITNLAKRNVAFSITLIAIASVITVFTNTERLRVLVSKNCGESWITRYSKQGSELVTNGGSEVSSDFVPTSSEWRTESVTLGSLFANEPNVLIRFEALSNLGNKLYIDNINIAQGALGLENLNSTGSAAVYPNPINENSVLELNTSANGNNDLILIDALGKRISTQVFPAQAGNNLIPLTEMTEHLPAGIYILSVSRNEVNTTLKLIVR